MADVARYTGAFEYLSPQQGAVQQGRCEVGFDRETLTVAGERGPMAFDLGDIDVFEPGEHELRLALYTGEAIRLTRFGKAFRDLQHHLLAAYRDRLVKCLLVSDLDEVARYTGRVSLQGGDAPCEGPAEIRLFESNVAVLPDRAAGFQWRLADVDAIEFDERDYRVVLSRARERLAIGKLAKRTGELADAIRERRTQLQQRSARVLHALFPFLSPAAFQQVAARMREGASAPIRDLRPVHRLLEPTLLDSVVDGGLRPYLRELVQRSGDDWHAGFKIVREDPEDADNAGLPEAVPPDGEGEEAEAAASGREPDPAVMQAGDGLQVLYWFFFPLASQTGRATHLAWEATSAAGRATYLFDVHAASAGEGGAEVAAQAINRGLVALNFRREPVYLPEDRLVSEARYRHYAIALRRLPELTPLRRAFVGRAVHRSVPAWRQQLDRLLGA